MVCYRCPDCGSDDEQFHHRHDAAPASIPCRGTRIVEQPRERIERSVAQPDGTVVLEYEEVEVAPLMEVCGGTALQRISLPGELWSRPARGFEPLVIYQSASDPNKFSFPGRNNEPTDTGYKRIEITSMAQYNQWAKHINKVEIDRMKDHRSMHEEYWKARRKAMREHVDARIRHSPALVSLARIIRKISDEKTIRRYGKPLNANFHSQLLEFDQGKIQDWCAEDTQWRARRAK